MLPKLDGWFSKERLLEVVPALKLTTKQNTYLLLKRLVQDSILEKKKLSAVSVLYRNVEKK